MPDGVIFLEHHVTTAPGDAELIKGKKQNSKVLRLLQSTWMGPKISLMVLKHPLSML